MFNHKESRFNAFEPTLFVFMTVQSKEKAFIEVSIALFMWPEAYFQKSKSFISKSKVSSPKRILLLLLRNESAKSENLVREKAFDIRTSRSHHDFSHIPSVVIRSDAF